MSTYTTKWYPFQRALRCRFFKSFDDKGGEIDFVNHIDTEIELFLFGGEKYTEPYVAQMQGHSSVVAPPTFPTCFRPVVQPPWFANLDRRRIVAGGISFEYERPVTAGMQLICRVQLTGVEEKSGAKGAMQLIHQETHGKNASGELVFISRRTTIYRSLDQVQKGSLA